MRQIHMPHPVSLVIRERDPLNLEFPFNQLDDLITPAEAFYVRSHFSIPQLDSQSHRLHVCGTVSRPLSLTMDDIREMPSEKTLATLECAGNSRVFLVPQQNGAQWELGAVGTAEWTGVRLSLLLERAGLGESASEIVLIGADQGTPKEKPKPPQPIHYARSISRQKALQPEVIVAYEMNGRDLPPEHGFPLRAIVAGHYGMASVKWLTRIEAVEQPFTGYWQTTDYSYWNVSAGNPVRRGLGEMKLKSEIARPGTYETLPAGATYTVFGAAWSGSEDVSEIEVSIDDGQTWQSGEFIDPIHPFSWRRWTYQLQVPSGPGHYVLMSRARDRNGRVQPAEHDSNYGSYAVHHTLPVQILVE